MMPDLSELRQAAGEVGANLEGRFAAAEGGAGGAAAEGGDADDEADSAEREAARARRRAAAELKVRPSHISKIASPAPPPQPHQRHPQPTLLPQCSAQPCPQWHPPPALLQARQLAADGLFLELLFWKGPNVADDVRNEYNWRVGGCSVSTAAVGSHSVGCVAPCHCGACG
jgi:hypothetical protein